MSLAPNKNPELLHSKCTCGGIFELPKNGQEWHLECDQCETILFCYIPMPHQEAFHKDTSKYRMWAGGYGSAKTSTCAAEIIDHILNTPKGQTLIGAETNPQLEETAQKTFMEMMPQKLIAHEMKQKSKIIMKNGHEVLFRPLDKENKARSLNLTAFWIEEANGVAYEYFEQLQQRLRSHQTKFHIGIISTNPDMNWVKSEFLLKTDPSRIYGGDVDYSLHINKDEIVDTYSVHIASTDQNIHLPPNYYSDSCKGKPQWWIRRFLHGSFENREGRVYPKFEECVVDPFEVPDDWERVQGSDFGLSNPTTALWGAINPETGVLYIYDEHYESERTVEYHAAQMNKRLSSMRYGQLRFAVGDPKGKARNEVDKKSLFDHYREYGIYFKEGNNKREAGIMKVFTMMDLGVIKVFRTCYNTIREGINYKYPNRTLAQSEKKNPNDLPLDKDDHAMDALRYICMELPDKIHLIKKRHYISGGLETATLSSTKLPHALQDDREQQINDWLSYY